ncbi:MAG: DUF4043 family protein [Hellea sp.]
MATQPTSVYDIMLRHNKQDFKQYNASHRYRKWMGLNQNAIIQRVKGLETDGEKVRLHFTDDIGRRNIGTGTMEGNETTWGTDYYDMRPYWTREAIKLKKSDAKKAVTNQASIQRQSLTTYIKNMEYDAILNALDAVAVDDAVFSETGAADGSTLAHSQQVTFLEASEAQRDKFLTDNAERIVIGADAGNVVAGDMSASLANLTVADDSISIRFLERMKRLARQDQWAAGGARPIRPVESKEGGKDYFKVVLGSNAFEQLSNDEDMKRYNTDARLRGVENHPIFEDGDLLYKGMMICEDPRQFTYAGLGNGGANIEPVKLLGAQALGAAIGQNMRYTKSDNRDYEFHDGVGVEAQYSFEKLFYRGGNRADKTHGMIEGYIAF